MTEAETILEMIETVDPANTDKLNEINARVYGYIAALEFIGFRTCTVENVALGSHNTALAEYEI